MKITDVITIMLIFANISFAQSQNSIQHAIEKFVNHGELKNAAISFAAYDMDNDSLIASYNDNMALPPASTVKLFTTATALETLGPFYIPKTKFFILGNIDSLGVLTGNLIINGGGDPTLGSRFFTNEQNSSEFLEEWVQIIRDKGITQIKGHIIADASEFGYQGAPDGWSWGDLGNYYGAGPSGLVLYDNMTRLHFSTPSELNQAAQLDSMTPEIPGYNLLNNITTNNSSRDNSYIYGAPYSYDRFAVGHLPRNQTNFEVKASIPDPEFLLAREVYNAMNEDSVEVTGTFSGMRELIKMGGTAIDYDDCKELFSYGKRNILDIAYWTNMRSVNLFAEQLIALIAYEKTAIGSTENGVGFVNNYWEPRLNIEMFQTDGSGLSRNNGFSAQHYIRLLDYMYNSKRFENFKSTLPIAGKSGTLRGVCRGQHAQGRLFAKSGTMNRIKSYAGYVYSSSGKKIAFALIVNNDNLSNNSLVKRMEFVFNALARY